MPDDQESNPYRSPQAAPPSFWSQLPKAWRRARRAYRAEMDRFPKSRIPEWVGWVQLAFVACCCLPGLVSTIVGIVWNLVEEFLLERPRG